MLTHFIYYRPHLTLLQKQMLEWKPRKKLELLSCGYKDPFVYFTVIFGIWIGVMSLLGVVGATFRQY